MDKFIYVLVTCVLTYELLNIHDFLLLSLVLLRTIQCSSGSSMCVYHFFLGTNEIFTAKKIKKEMFNPLSFVWIYLKQQ